MIETINAAEKFGLTREDQGYVMHPLTDITEKYRGRAGTPQENAEEILRFINCHWAGRVGTGAEARARHENELNRYFTKFIDIATGLKTGIFHLSGSIGIDRKDSFIAGTDIGQYVILGNPSQGEEIDTGLGLDDSVIQNPWKQQPIIQVSSFEVEKDNLNLRQIEPNRALIQDISNLVFEYYL
jgi:hypothetical protein